MNSYNVRGIQEREKGLMQSNGPQAKTTGNYRSCGIVQCAHSVIELIADSESLPHAIDVSTREKGVVDGSKPVFLSGWDSETVRYVWTCVTFFNETVYSSLDRNNFYSVNRESDFIYQKKKNS